MPAHLLVTLPGPLDTPAPVVSATGAPYSVLAAFSPTAPPTQGPSWPRPLRPQGLGPRPRPARVLTGALLEVAALLERVAAQLAMEVVLPEFRKPDVAPVVVQRAAGEVAVEAWQGTRMSGPRDPPSPPIPSPSCFLQA